MKVYVLIEWQQPDPKILGVYTNKTYAERAAAKASDMDYSILGFSLRGASKIDFVRRMGQPELVKWY